MQRKVAVVLSGCGYLDGSEITEAVASLINLAEAEMHYECFAPSIEAERVSHLDHVQDNRKQNVLLESARIARGNIKPLSDLSADNFDALLMPGGFGAAKNLSDFAYKGINGKVIPELEKLILDFYQASKPIAAFCIAPAILALVLGKKGIEITIGNDKATASVLERLGASHIECDVDDFVTDRANKIITSPAYMYDANPYQVYVGIRKAIQELREMA